MREVPYIYRDAQDCDDVNPDVWNEPVATPTLRLHHIGGAGGTTFLDWVGATASGSTAAAFDVVRSKNPASFGPLEPTAICLESRDATDSFATDEDIPANLFVYLVVARNDCGSDAGTDSTGAPRTVRSCP